MIHIWEQLAHSLLTLDPTLASRGGEMGEEGLQAATAPTSSPLCIHGWPRERVVGQMQGPQYRCGQQREEGISFAGPFALFKWSIASQI